MLKELSLLYNKPGERLRATIDCDNMPDYVRDLNIDKIVDWVCKNDEYEKRILLKIITELCVDSELINYRFDIIDDFINNPRLLTNIQPLLKLHTEIYKQRNQINRNIKMKDRLMREITVLLEYVQLLERVNKALIYFKEDFKSCGLKKMAECICGYCESGHMNELTSILKSLKSDLRMPVNIKLHINIGYSFKLVDALLTDIGITPFVPSPGSQGENVDTGKSGSHAFKLPKLFKKDPEPNTSYIIKQIDSSLNNYVETIRNKALSKILSVISGVSGVLAEFFRNLEEEFIYYNSIIKFVNALQQYGVTVCKPKIVAVEERRLEAQNIYDLSYVLYLTSHDACKLQEIITNDVTLSPNNGMYVVTGPNQGGKTTFLRAVGIIQVLAQAGIPVPAAQAVVSPVDMIYTHFPVDEKLEENEGRLGEELERFSSIVKTATESSLVLMNESFATTNSNEGGIIAGDLLKALAVIGVRGIFVTHLYELAGRVTYINEYTEQIKADSTKLVSMISAVETNEEKKKGYNGLTVQRTYKIVSGAPMESSFANDIAIQYGIGYEQLLEKINLKKGICLNTESCECQK